MVPRLKPGALTHAASELVMDAEKAAAKVDGLIPQAANVSLGEVLGVENASVGRVSRAEKASLAGKYPDLSNRFQNALAGAEKLDDNVSALRPAGRLLEAGKSRRFAALMDDMVTSLAVRVEKLLSGSLVADLTAVQRAEIEAAVRVQMIANTRAYTSGLNELNANAAKLLKTKRFEPLMTPVTTPDGVWFFMRRQGRADEILAEVFVPLKPLEPGHVPVRPAKIPQASKPRWLRQDGTFGDLPPSNETVRKPLDLDTNVVDRAPGALLDQMALAEKEAQTGIAEQIFNERRVKYREIRPKDQRAVGSGIRSAERQSLASAEREFERELLNADEVLTLDGEVMKLLKRVDDTPDPAHFSPESVQKIKSIFGDKFEPPFNQLHAWGKILGDSTPLGISVGPAWLNQLQLRTIESFLKAGEDVSDAAKRLQLEVKVYTKSLVLEGKTQRFFRGCEYTFVVDGKKATAFIWLERDGAARLGTRVGNGGTLSRKRVGSMADANAVAPAKDWWEWMDTRAAEAVP